MKEIYDLVRSLGGEMNRKFGKLINILLFLAVVAGYQNCGNFESGRLDGSASSLNNEPAYFKLGRTGLQKVTKQQLTNGIEDIFQISLGQLADEIPDDQSSSTYFSNDSEALSFSQAVTEGHSQFAEQLSKFLIANPNWFTRITQCNPTQSTDEDCLRQSIFQIGRHLLRRSITVDEVERYTNAFIVFAQQDNNFFSAIEVALLMFFQHPEFIYRIENNSAGTLDGFAIANRMSFLIWGSFPDLDLLTAAENGDLLDPLKRVAQADRMLNDPRALRQANDFHSMWLGYKERVLPNSIDRDARLETEALIQRVLFDDKRAWLDIFNFDETFLSPALAQHYGMNLGSSRNTWVRYPAGQRGGGLLSHATIASLGDKFGDTSPTLRGYEIYKRVFCGELVGTIPPGVDVDFPPGDPTDCKEDTYSMRNNNSCATCHAVTDNIGFGLENTGAFGTWRTTQVNNSRCQVSGRGSFQNESFVGPAELGLLITKNSDARMCLSKQLFEYFVGRGTGAEDESTLRALKQQYDKDPSYQAMIKFMVGSEEIKFKN